VIQTTITQTPLSTSTPDETSGSPNSPDTGAIVGGVVGGAHHLLLPFQLTKISHSRRSWSLRPDSSRMVHPSQTPTRQRRPIRWQL